jgi:hypothetical protein
MKFAFFYPAKLMMGERHIPARVVSDNVLSFDKKNVYYDTKREMVAFMECEENHYYIKVGDHVMPIRHFQSDEAVLEFLKRDPEQVKAWVAQGIECIANPEIYNEKCRANLEKIKAEREARDKEIEEREKARAEAAEQAIIDAGETYKAGGFISWAHFEELCKRNSVAMPKQTLGWGRNSVDEISTTSLQGVFKTISKEIGNVSAALKKALTI